MMNLKDQLLEVLGTKLADKIDGVEFEMTADKVRITIVDGKVDVQADKLKTKMRLTNGASMWEQQKEEMKKVRESTHA